jgi:hypothetical protein
VAAPAVAAAAPVRKRRRMPMLESPAMFDCEAVLVTALRMVLSFVNPRIPNPCSMQMLKNHVLTSGRTSRSESSKLLFLLIFFDA